MKYLKKYESWEREQWKIPLKYPDFFICLKKFGMIDSQLEHWEHLYRNKTFFKIHDIYSPHIKYIILRKDTNGSKSGWDFTWREFNKKSDKDKETIIVSPEEVQEYYDEIEAKKDMSKYNL